ncbi:UDP-N-acetylglucosamine 1-carboxyvinyltransferase [Blautia liquoris]|uniref:UDP-N-acetylglucosamine 1-carboxyvinyltransferase n=1 Tax=Blautia liquoris TaxID=2779518 RepID=A0A7M2RIZ4_9FIRM|nr:UDP-N-acetylglucosamine 1-carboxyvinyltransferase [Blautia liquoris]QOV20229.1 UDP-N-acetylglucosamine 1-carboxyvinyltransferase [Blautia liquoris]
MGLYEIEGGIPLDGEVRIQGSKNAVLPMMAAALLQRGTLCLKGCPDILDVRCMERILKSIGAGIKRDADDIYIDCSQIDSEAVPGAYADKMRSSVILMGALLGRTKKVRIGLPGGCTIGKRPVDLHLMVLEALGAHLKVEDGMITGYADEMKGGFYRFERRSVGATENAVLAAVCADGVTILENCAKEPEIVHLCRLLRAMGAEIEGEKSGRICIKGVSVLTQTTFQVPADRIVAGTYLLAGAATRGQIILDQAPDEEMSALLSVYHKMGGQYEVKGGKLISDSRNLKYPAAYLETEEYPGFPTDLQSPLLAVCAGVTGVSQVNETIFENRFKAALQMRKMGADIRIEKSTAIVHGCSLYGADVEAFDLRGGAALVLAGLCAKGTTRISGIRHIERGYQDICGDIRSLGGRIKKKVE